MRPIHVISLSVLLTAVVPYGSPAAGPETTTWTGWFSDKGCAAPRVKAGNISPNGVECAKKCLREGAEPVFISEQAKALYTVKDFARVIEEVGYHVEIAAVVDEETQSLTVQSVKRLSEVTQMCARPPKK